MNNIRIIPTLLMQNKKLVKTTRFKKPRYIGDPINTIRIYNNLFVDEIILLDINQSTSNTAIDFDYLQQLASECFMPICYGGGITSLETAEKLYAIGIEKLSINTAAIQNLQLIRELSKHFGSQSIVGGIDTKKYFLRGYKVHRTAYHPVDYALRLEDAGCGELLIYSTDRDGVMNGYDLEILALISQKVSIPIIACGGAGKLMDMKALFNKTGINAFAAGSLFVYYSNLKTVLINYPDQEEIKKVFANS